MSGTDSVGCRPRVCASGMAEALWALPPVRDLGLIDFISLVIDHGQARRIAGGAIDIDHPTTGTADQMVVVVINPILEEGRRPGRLDPPDEADVNQDRQRVVHRLARNGADLTPTISANASAVMWGWLPDCGNTARRWAVTWTPCCRSRSTGSLDTATVSSRFWTESRVRLNPM